MFRLYFATNALIGPPSGIDEYQPGFLGVSSPDDSLAVAVFLAVAPWFVVPRMDAKARPLSACCGSAEFSVCAGRSVADRLVGGRDADRGELFAFLPTP